MKILFLSIPSIHAVRWIENLREAGYDLYWFDVVEKGKLATTIPIQQITDWKKRKIPYIKGEHFLRKKMPWLYDKIQPFLEVTANEKLQQILQQIQPDVVHSFEMQNSCYPILETMQKYSKISWLYSCWGSDLFYYQHKVKHLAKIKAVLNRINYLHTDCERDFIVTKELGFTGKHVGIIPGGGGFHLEKFSPFIQNVFERKIILVKGYQHHVGRALVVVKALQRIQSEIRQLGFEVVVFGAHKVVLDYVVTHQLPFQVHDRHALAHHEVLQIMGKAALYIGNSLSDGMPNTLLEAIIMGAFPMQSNPGKVTLEIITHEENGFLIENPNDDINISVLILKVLQQPDMLEKAFEINQQLAKERLEYAVNQQKIVALYRQIENESCE